MPWAQFLLMLKEGRILLARENSTLANLHAISTCNVEYYKVLKRQFHEEIFGDEPLPELPALPAGAMVDASGVEAQNVLMGMCRALKGGLH